MTAGGSLADKAMKWAFACFGRPHAALELVCSMVFARRIAYMD